MVIETERLTLRDYLRADWKDVHTYASDAELVQFMEWGPNTEADTKAFIQSMIETQETAARRTFGLAMVVKDTGKLIGGCQLDVLTSANGTLGYCLSRESWGRGYATEAAKALCNLGFLEFNLHRIFATCRPENIASAKVLERIGMKKEGIIREHFYAKGKWQNSFLYSLLVHEFTG